MSVCFVGLLGTLQGVSKRQATAVPTRLALIFIQCLDRENMSLSVWVESAHEKAAGGLCRLPAGAAGLGEDEEGHYGTWRGNGPPTGHILLTVPRDLEPGLRNPGSGPDFL